MNIARIHPWELTYKFLDQSEHTSVRNRCFRAILPFSLFSLCLAKIDSARKIGLRTISKTAAVAMTGINHKFGGRSFHQNRFYLRSTPGWATRAFSARITVWVLFWTQTVILWVQEKCSFSSTLFQNSAGPILMES